MNSVSLRDVLQNWIQLSDDLLGRRNFFDDVPLYSDVFDNVSLSRLADDYMPALLVLVFAPDDAPLTRLVAVTQSPPLWLVLLLGSLPLWLVPVVGRLLLRPLLGTNGLLPRLLGTSSLLPPLLGTSSLLPRLLGTSGLLLRLLGTSGLLLSVAPPPLVLFGRR